MKFCNYHLTRIIFNLNMQRFFFGLVYTYIILTTGQFDTLPSENTYIILTNGQFDTLCPPPSIYTYIILTTGQFDIDCPLYILGQKRNAAYNIYIVYGGLSPISRKRCVTVWALILRLWVPRVVLAIIVAGQNWFINLNLRFYRSWRRIFRRRWRHECAQSYLLQFVRNVY